MYMQQQLLALWKAAQPPPALAAVAARLPERGAMGHRRPLTLLPRWRHRRRREQERLRELTVW